MKRTNMSTRQFERLIILLSLTRWIAGTLRDLRQPKLVELAHNLVDAIATAVNEDDEDAA
jgi:hypothetical protein